MFKHYSIVVAICCVTTLLAGCEGGRGFGQTFDSPNGKLNASATQYYGDDLAVQETRYRIVDKSSGKTIWKHDEKGKGSNDPPWGGGFGNLELIQWSDDSSEVRFATRCTETVNVTDWIAARTDQSGDFTTGVATKNRCTRSPTCAWF